MSTISAVLKKYQPTFHPVISANGTKTFAHIDLSENNTSLCEDIFKHQSIFSTYIEQCKIKAQADFLIGGYGELRNVYNGIEIFGDDEPRRFHLGVDIWGEPGTPVHSFLGGMIHSFAFNNKSGDYGATLVLLHQLDGIPFYTLYGHISLSDIDSISQGQYVSIGEKIAHIGNPDENGNWPPHLHFQVITDMELYYGDYPGVCKFSEREKYLANCPDPNLILKFAY